jgi:guanylate kinase
MTDRTNGKLIVITGPSGVGKGTLVRSLLDRHPELHLSTSATTRPPRPGEVDGKDYFFVSRHRFRQMAERGELLEWAEFAGNYYGTPRQAVSDRLEAGESVLLEIELEGARQISRTLPEAVRVFIEPPSMEELERRLHGRGQDSKEAIARRLNRAKVELEAKSEFHFTLVNDDLDRALDKLEALLFVPV